ncbi:hypothetical protein [Pseudanabaena yagii]|uniref:Uncharacterized protein n=1 Tax=Pseudanabaena yagii GIHE-NHR1 TaxID=2722753 RepID=A0ABX1LWK4_9CYAN|nr:hypothetical protein [Pseudanabaena yagii]NMF59731.1 hypothetical protein [Pseudanabaena yagii GIHE-NHR1]
MKILEHSSKRLVIYSRPIRLWLTSVVLPIIGFWVGSFFLEVNSFNCKRSATDPNFCQKVVIQTRRTQLIGVEIRQNEAMYKLKFTTTDQYLEWLSLVWFLFWMTISLYVLLRVLHTRTCIFDKNINQLIIETKGLLGKKIVEYSLSEIIDIVISGGGFSVNEVPIEPVDLMLKSDKNVSVYIDLDVNSPSKWYQKAYDTVDLIQSFLGLVTETTSIQDALTHSSTKKFQSCRVIYCMGYIIAIGNIPVKYSDKTNMWGIRNISSIGDIPVEYGKIGQLGSSKQIISIGDVCITYRPKFWQLRPCIDSIGDMAVQYNSDRQIISIGDMDIQYDRAGHITAISDMNVQSDSYGRIIEIHSNGGFNLKQFVALFLLVLSKNTNRDREGGGGGE